MTTSLSYTLRPLQATDEAWLAEFMYQAIFVPEGTPPPPRTLVEEPRFRKYYQDFGRAGDLGCVAVATETHAPLGAAWVRLVKDGYGYVDDQTPELVMAVMPGYRGQGIGTTLLQHLMRIAQPQYAAISLSVWPDNPAYRLYQRLGFELVRSNPNQDVILVKRLQA